MASSKPRQQRLRASCDGCFLAKVKCSKARPICSRCLACGIECRYSPSSRAGKPKSDGSSNLQSSMPSDMPGMSPGSDKGMLFSHHSVPNLYKLETGWHTPPTSVDGGMSRSHSMSGLALMGVETSPHGLPDTSLGGDLYGAGMPWTPPNDLSAQFVESPGIMGQAHGRAHSYDFAMAGTMAPWGDPNAQDMFAYGQVQTPASIPPTYFPSPTATPHLRLSPRQKSASTTTPPAAPFSGSCTCFTACLQSLQALHNASSPSAPPPFDLILSLNRKAVDGCASMLSCPRCMSRSGSHTAAMLLATVIGKVTSFYQIATHTYFETGGGSNSPGANTAGGGSPPSVSLGTYTLLGEDGRWLERTILTRELRKLEEVYAQYRDMCADLFASPGGVDDNVGKAMVAYLGHMLCSTIEAIHNS